MASFANIMKGIATFILSTAFVYFSYPFFYNLLTAMDATGADFDGWNIVKIILWGGYWLMAVTAIFIIPLITIANNNND